MNPLPALGLLVGSLAMATAAGTNAADTPPSRSSREARWKEDLGFYARELPARHVRFGKLVSAARFGREVRQLQAEAPRLSDSEIVLRLMRQTASLGIAHTRVGWPGGSLAFHQYPVAFYWCSDGLAVAAATAEHREALGSRVLRMGSRTPEEAFQAIAPYVSHDNEAGLRGESPVFMRVAELLQHLGIAEPGGELRLELERSGGQRLAVAVAPAPASAPAKWVQLWDAWATPRRRFANRADEFYWHEFLPEARALYVQYNSCAEAPANPFSSFARTLFAAADTQAVERVIVDLRGNGGGDSRVVEPLLTGLKARPALTAKGRLYVLIGRGTCSSGMWAALGLRDGFKAVLVGEPTGGKPNACGDVRVFSLPNSGVQVRYSTKQFKGMTAGDPRSVEPGVTALLSLQDLRDGHDPALEAALRDRRP